MILKLISSISSSSSKINSSSGSSSSRINSSNSKSCKAFIDYYYYYFFRLLREHRASTTFFHLPLSLALVLASSHVKPEFRSSQFRLLLQVCFGRPLLLFPCGFHSRACLVIFPGSFRRV